MVSKHRKQLSNDRPPLPHVWLIACLALVVLLACQPQGARDREVALEDVVRDGEILRVRDEESPFTGWVVDSYEDGQPRSRAYYQYGQLNGLSEGWYASGALEVQETFLRGVSNGEKSRYYENGQLRSQGMVVDGEYDGVYQRWSDAGVLTESVSLTNGVPHGVSKAWRSDGTLKSVVRMQGGEAVDSTFYDEDGQPTEE